MIWLLGFIACGMVYRFVNAVSKCEVSMIWYGLEILALGMFIKGLMI